MRSVRIIGVLAVVLLPLAAPANNPAHAQQASDTRSVKFVPVPWNSLRYDPRWFAVPDTALGYDPAVLDTTRFRKYLPEILLSDTLDLGAYRLRLDTERTVTVYAPYAATESVELAEVLVTPRGGKKRGRTIRNYFGLTLTAPAE